jgi:hypothetical protein
MTGTELDQYKVKPRESRDGWNLISERLSHGALWYANEADAISCPKWHSRVKGCKINVVDEKDPILRTEEFSPGDFAY